MKNLLVIIFSLMLSQTYAQTDILQAGGNKVSTAVHLKATSALDYPSISPLTSVTLTLTVTGATTQDVATVQPVSGVGSNMIVTAWVSGPDTVTVSMSNLNAIAIDLPSQTFNVLVTKY